MKTDNQRKCPHCGALISANSCEKIGEKQNSIKIAEAKERKGIEFGVREDGELKVEQG